MRTFFQLPPGAATLLKYNLAACACILALLEFWRPCYFLTDDNFSGLFPVMTEIGRHFKHGESPFVSVYLFGGHYNWLRDAVCPVWHPFYLLPALLCDTPAQFWMVDLSAFCSLFLTTAGLTILAASLRAEFNPRLTDRYLVLYTLSFVFCTYVLTAGPSWVNFLINQSALPWLTLGVLDRRLWRGALLVTVFTMHEFLGGYAGMTVSNLFYLSLFAVGVALARRSALPAVIWYAGNLIAVVVLIPFLLEVLDGFVQSQRQGILSVWDASLYNIPPATFPGSYFAGNWTDLAAAWTGAVHPPGLEFPSIAKILACAAAWCLLPALLASPRWRPLEIVCLVLALVLVVMIVRPTSIALAMQHIPFIRSMRWPFRESLQLLFFLHLFFILRPQERFVGLLPLSALLGLALFLLPLPFSTVPTFNALALDRQLLFSGRAEAFWAGVKTQLKPGDQIATVIQWSVWQKESRDLPYSVLGTASFPAYFQVHCISGYSPTAPLDQVALKTWPWYWFGAFREYQVPKVSAERPDVKFIRVTSVHPLKLTLTSADGTVLDLTPYLSVAPR